MAYHACDFVVKMFHSRLAGQLPTVFGGSVSVRSVGKYAQVEEGATKRCPVCGQGTLVEITFREGSAMEAEAGEAIQEADTRQVESYSCGHEVVGPRLDESAAGTKDLEVERRETDETAEPL